MSRTCYQVNLQPGWGGGEIYTVFFTRALAALGIDSVIFVAGQMVDRWQEQLPRGTRVVGVSGADSVAGAVATHLPPNGRAWLMFQTPLGERPLAPLRAAGHLLTCIAHMPLYGRDATTLRAYDLVVPVSGHVLDSLRAAGIEKAYAQPLYGVADLAPRLAGNHQVRRYSRYDWDRRKLRDRLLGICEPWIERLRPHSPFVRADGIALGIVSRLTPIKQFPLLFSCLAPVLARHPSFRLEIFGSGGYASVRDLRRALAPIRHSVRFWGQQANVAAIYGQLDYLLTGLPEKEALGLNVIEAQACGLPVLAVDAPPFTETVADGVTGLFYTDPRTDDSTSFGALIARLEAQPFIPDAAATTAHLEKFSEAAFAERVMRLVATTAKVTGAST